MKIRALASLILWIKLLCGAYVLDFDTVSWTPGATDVTFNNVDGSGVNVRIQITGDLNFYTGSYPKIDSSFHGGTYENTLTVYMNWPSDTDSIRVRVTFSENVQNVTFGIFDIDQGSGSSPNFTFVDQIRNITGQDSGANPATFSTTYNPAYINQSGSNFNAINGGVPGTSSNGNLWVDFGSSQVNLYQFNYRNQASETTSNPAEQAIGLYDISFTTIGPVIPETKTYFMYGGLACLLLIGKFGLKKESGGS